MRGATVVAQQLVRLCAVILIVLGVLFWTGHARNLIPVHMLIGLILVLALWVLAGIGARASVGSGLVASAVVLGLVVLVFGMTQRSIMPGAGHVIIRILHLILGLAAIGMAEQLARRIKQIETAPSA